MAEVINVQAPDQAPVEAPSLTQFADLEKTPQANTTILPDATALNEQMIQAAQYRHAWEEADYQRHQKAISDRIDKMNINTAGTWEVDIPEIQGEVNDYLDYVGKHPELEEPTAKNLHEYTALQQRKNQILADIDKSKQDKALFGEQQKFIQQHSDQRWNNPNNNSILTDYENFNVGHGKSLRDRKWGGFKAPDFYNPLTKIDFGELKEVKHEYPTGKGSQTESIETKERTPNQILGALQNYKQGQDFTDFSNHYIGIKSNIAQGKQPDYIIDVPKIEGGYNRKTKDFDTYKVPLSKASLDEILRSDKVPSGAAYNEIQGLQGNLLEPKSSQPPKAMSWAAKWANDIVLDRAAGLGTQQEKTDEQGNKTVTNNNSSKFYPAPSKWTEKVDNPDYDNNEDESSTNRPFETKNVVGVVKQNGKFYKVYSDKTTGDTKTGYKFKTSDVVKPENEIVNFWNEVVIPNTNEGKADETAQGMRQFFPKSADRIQVPQLFNSDQNESSNSIKSENKSYQYNGKAYSQEAVQKAAQQSGLSVDDYIKQAGLK